jgi:hypothetical protein
MRDPLTLVRKWWSMIDMFSLIIVSFSSAQFDSVSTILVQLSHAINNNAFQASGLKVQDLVAWAEGGQGGWFAMMYNRYVHVNLFQHN